jgi:hypothetical protein
MPLASIEPEDNEPETPEVKPGHTVHPTAHNQAKHETAEPVYEEAVEPAKRPARHQTLSDADNGMPLGDDDLDVPAFIRRKVE